ncbi:MAG: type II toxin-antitoxin system RelE/ParE family toxin, partial [Oscillospiraceae bacterium]|nr:type II toxin-antitoxin system RelE/ParE family toxin [Oscillospiraceae bacterium]
MKTYRVKITARAEKDVEAIHRYLAEEQHAPETARRVCEQLAEGIASLERSPERCPLLESEPERSRGLRSLSVGDYAVVFVIGGEDVTVLRVLSSEAKTEVFALPNRVMLKSLVRSPLKTILTFVLLGVTAFFFVFNLSTYVAQQKTAKEVEEGTIGVLTAENTPPRFMENPLYGYFPNTVLTSPATPRGQITYENCHQQPFTAEEEAALEALPYISAVDRRYMTAGVSEDYLRLYDYPQYFGCQDRVILEGTVADVEVDEWWNRFLYSDTYEPQGVRDVWLTDVKLLVGDEDYLKVHQEIFDGRARVLIASLKEKNYEGHVMRNGVHYQQTVGRMDLRLLVQSMDYEVTLKDLESIVPGRRYVFILREDPTVDPEEAEGRYVLYAMGDDTRKGWWPYFTDITDLPENYLEGEDFAELRSLIRVSEDDRHTFDVVYTDNMASIRRVTQQLITPVQGRFLTPEDEEKPVCVVSEAFLEQTGLHIGDSIDLRLGNVFMEQYAAMGAVAMTKGRYATEWTPASFTVVGSFEDAKDGKWLGRDLFWAYSDSTIFVPVSFLPESCDTENHLFRPGEISFIVGEAKNIPAFEEEGLPLLEELSLSYKFEDRNWPAVANKMEVVKSASLVRLLAFGAAALLAVALTVYLFLVRRKKEYAILRALGCPRKDAATALSLPLLLLAAVSVLAGTAAARLRAGLSGQGSAEAITDGLETLSRMSALGYALAFLGFLCLIGLVAFL